MPIAHDDPYNEMAEAAIERVLLAERAAREAVAQCRLEADRIAERARLGVCALEARTERRARAVIGAFEREVDERLAGIKLAAEQAARAQPFSEDESAALRRAVRAVAAELITAPP